MDQDLPELPNLRNRDQPDPQAASGSNSLPQSITAPPQVHVQDTGRFMARVPSEESVKEEPLVSPYDQRDNPYDAASSAIHGPTRPMSRKRTTETQISRGLDWIVPHDMTEKRVSPYRVNNLGSLLWHVAEF